MGTHPIFESDFDCLTDMAKGKKTGKKKTGAKSSSNVFSMFEQQQIQEYKEAFGMIDANRDGFIDKDDLRATYASLGLRDINGERLEAMIAEAPAQINFTVFLNMLADKLHGTDPEDVILNAFKLLDPEGTGLIPKSELDLILGSQADRFKPDELEQLYKIAPINDEGMVDYKSLCYIITHGQEEE